MALAMLVACLPLWAAQKSGVSFSKDIAPILVAKCQTCHGPDKAKGKYRLHTFESLMKPGSSDDPSITPGDPKKSALYNLLVAKDPDDRMPQKDDALPAAQINLVERWIKEGAKFDGPNPKQELVSLMPKVEHPKAPEVYPQPLPVTALVYSLGGQNLITSGYNEILIWNIETRQLVKRIGGVATEVDGLALSPDGKLIAAATGQAGKLGEVLLIPLDTGKVRVLATLSDVALGVAFSPDGTRLASCGSDNAIRLFDVATGKELRRIEQHADWTMAVTWSPDGKRLASASRDKTARTYDATTGEMLANYPDHGEPVFDVTFAGNNDLVASVGRDRKLHLWNATDGKRAKDFKPVGGFGADIWRLLSTGKELITGCRDHEIRLYDIAQKKITRKLSGHTDWVQSLALSPDGKQLASGAHNGELIVWNLADGKIVTRFTPSPGFHSTVAKAK